MPAVAGGAARFATTHWSVVLTASEESSAEKAEALEKLCRIYWYPLYVFVRRQDHQPHDAQDLTQSFFARLLDKRYLNAVDLQPVNTLGGNAPSNTGTTDGQIARVPYTAEYYFYRAQD